MVRNLPVMQRQELDLWTVISGEENGNPVQYSRLENSMDRTRSHKESDTTEQLAL